jgi:tRNA A37 methylthiotransferase MiaB
MGTGCTSHCTFCSERIVWGKVNSRPPEKIISEFAAGLEAGHRRFELLAGDLGAYGHDRGTNLPGLLSRILRTFEGRTFRFLLPQLHPHHLKRDFDEYAPVFRSGCVEMLGSPVQSGSDRILKLMGRKYTSGDWRDLMLTMNREYPSIRLMPQFMVGFPGETEEDFRGTLALLAPPLVLDGIKVFVFSRRPTIPADRLPGHVSEETKRERYLRLTRRFGLTYPVSAALALLRRALR